MSQCTYLILSIGLCCEFVLDDLKAEISKGAALVVVAAGSPLAQAAAIPLRRGWGCSRMASTGAVRSCLTFRLDGSNAHCHT